MTEMIAASLAAQKLRAEFGLRLPSQGLQKAIWSGRVAAEKRGGRWYVSFPDVVTLARDVAASQSTTPATQQPARRA